MAIKSESKTSQKKVIYPKTSQRYWLEKVSQRGRVVDGELSQGRHYTVQIQHQGRRTRFALDTGNKAAAADKSAEIYLDILKFGWDKALKEHKSARKAPNQDEDERKYLERPSVGDLVRVAAELTTARRSTFNGYVKALRKIYSETQGVPRGAKYDGRKGGAKEWQGRVDQVYLDQLTPEQVLRWRNQFLGGEDEDPTVKRSRIHTVNTLIRNSRGLMAQKYLSFLSDRMRLPDPLPFAGIQLLKPPSMRYHSKINAHEILRKAGKELKSKEPEQFKALLLALVCGLRRGEIDNLLWDAFDFGRKVLRVQNSQYHELKSEDSAGEIDLSDEMNAYFKLQHKRAKGAFVIESDHQPRKSESGTRYYRSNLVFKKLGEWLKDNGGDSKRPLHELRKEAGSLVAAEYGIFEASRFLRHSDIRITSQVYLDKKRRVTPSLSLALK